MYSTTLTAKQARFVSEYLVDGNGAASAIRAGYSERSAKAIAAENLTKPDLQRAIQARQAADATRLSIQREDVLNGLVEAAETAKLQCDPAGMVAAWKQVGHLMGYYSPERIKVDVNLAGSLEMGRLNQLSDAELLKIIDAGQAA